MRLARSWMDLVSFLSCDTCCLVNSSTFFTYAGVHAGSEHIAPLLTYVCLGIRTTGCALAAGLGSLFAEPSCLMWDTLGLGIPCILAPC